MLVAHRPILHGCTDPGLQRHRNEDAHRTDPDLGLAILADGMGGSLAGDVAARLAVEGVHRSLDQGLRRQPELLDESLDESHCIALEGLLRRAVSEVNREILQRSRSDPACTGMGTTLVVAVWRGADLIIGHVGDSRAYRLRRASTVLPMGHVAPHTLRCLTRDHVTPPSEPDEPIAGMRALPSPPSRGSHRLTRAVGVEEGLVLELHRHRLEPHDVILLCSDGLSDLVSDAQIERTVAAVLAPQPGELTDASLAALGQALIQRALDAGGHDNITAILGCQGARS